MTGREVLERALKLLGYTAADGNEQLSRRILNRAVEVINTVYEDLHNITATQELTPIESLSDEIKLQSKALSVMHYGVAAFIAQSEDDGDSQQLWMTVYNKKRASLSQITKRIDVIERSADL